MTEYVLVDTDILIDVGRNITTAIASLQKIEQQAMLAISTITQMELFIGCRNKIELQAVERFLARFPIISLNEPISNMAVDLLRRYRLSHGLLIADALIAATAIVNNHSLLTKNQRDYRFIDGLNLLTYP